MTTDKTARVEKLQFDIDREAAKILALSCGKIDEYKYWIKCRIHWTRPTYSLVNFNRERVDQIIFLHFLGH